MLLSRTVQSSLVSSRAAGVAVSGVSEKEASKGHHQRLSVLPLAILLLSGLVASRLLPDAPSSASSPFSLDVQPVRRQQQAAAGLNVTAPELQCHSWCLSRGTFSTPGQLQHCYAQCLAHPEVQAFIPALEASAGAALGTNRTLMFVAWYAEGERGSEVRYFFPCPLPSSPLP
jgi:hypothetical protein